MTSTAAITLVVDDERMVRMLVRRILEPEVCAVVEAADGESALRLIERGEPVIDVVLTDLVMPGIDGFDIAAVLARHRPELPVVCMSGFALTFGGRLEVPFLAKPFSVETLRSAMDSALAQRAATREAASERPRPARGGGRRGGLDLVAAALELRRLRARPAPPS